MFIRILLSTIGSLLMGVTLGSFRGKLEPVYSSWGKTHQIRFDLSSDFSIDFIILFVVIGVFLGIVWGLRHKGIFGNK